MSLSIAALCLLQALIVNAQFGANGVVVHAASAVTTAPAGCSTAAILVDECSSLIPDFDEAPASIVAACICYDGTTWDPSRFDGAVSQCAAYLSTEDPSDWSTYAELIDFCTDEGNVVAGPTSTAVLAKTTPAATVTTPASATAGGSGVTACEEVEAAISSCEAATVNFINLEGSQQASCVCYTGASWNPNGFDGPVATCAGYLSTADPSDYSNIASLESFCTKQGNVKATGSSSALVLTNSPLSASAGFGATGPGTSTPTTTPATTKASSQAVVVVTASPATTTSKSGAMGTPGSFSQGGMLIYLGSTLAIIMLGMCIAL